MCVRGIAQANVNPIRTIRILSRFMNDDSNPESNSKRKNNPKKILKETF